MPVFHEKKVVFVHVPKTGGTTIRKIIKFDNAGNLCNITNLWGYPHLGHVKYQYDDTLKNTKSEKDVESIVHNFFGTKSVCLQHISFKEIKSLTALIFDLDTKDYKSYGIVRNPIDRFFSAFMNKQYLNGSTSKTKKFNYDVMNFLEKIDGLPNSQMCEGSFCHYRKQSELLEGVNKVFCFDDIDSAVKEVCESITEQKIETVTQENRNRNSTYQAWKENVEEKTLDTLNNFYKEDILLYTQVRDKISS